MALTYGFFNAVNSDRTYNADQISNMFEGLISDGVYESVGSAYLVTANSGMIVNVGTGRALLRAKWAKNDAPVSVEITAANAILPRYTAVVLRLDVANRAISIETIDGSPTSTPTKPSILRTDSYYDLLLAYILVPAGATSISQSNIEDMRANTTYCGWVTGVVTQVDTSSLFLQWETAYEEFYAQMVAWKAEEQAAFETWFEALTEQLQVNTYIQEYEKNASIAYGASKVVSLDMTGYTYDADDIIMVYINGLLGKKNVDYTVNTSGTTPTVTFMFAGTSGITEDVTIKVLKSRIGSSQL